MPKVKTATCWLLTSLLLIWTIPVWGADKAKDEETIKNASTVLEAMLKSNAVPKSLLVITDCIIILPSVKKFAVGVGGSGGRGVMSCRSEKNFTGGQWSVPAMVSIGGASAGAQIGGSSTDFVLLVMSPSAANKVLQGKVKVGSDLTAAVGPSGATTAGSAGGTDIVTYGHAKGLFAGISLNGATLNPDSDANQRLYDKAVSAREIVVDNTVKPTPAGESLVSLLNTIAA
jgi:SH3 domain-containing YSC84-like protein 1